MAGKYRIKWSESDTEKLKRIVERFNKKIESVPDAIKPIQPAKVDYSSLESELKNYPRRELERTIRGMEAYLKDGVEMPYTTRQGVNITLWEKNQIENGIRTINARRKAELDRGNRRKGGERELIELRPKKNQINSIKPKDWERYRESIERILRYENEVVKNEQYKSNFLKAIEEQIGKNSELYDTVLNLSPSELVSLGELDTVLKIAFVYDPLSKAQIEHFMLEHFEQLMLE